MKEIGIKQFQGWENPWQISWRTAYKPKFVTEIYSTSKATVLSITIRFSHRSSHFPRTMSGESRICNALWVVNSNTHEMPLVAKRMLMHCTCHSAGNRIPIPDSSIKCCMLLAWHRPRQQWYPASAPSLPLTITQTSVPESCKIRGSEQFKSPRLRRRVDRRRRFRRSCCLHILDGSLLTLNLLTWRIWWAPNNASKWQMGFNSAFKGLNPFRGCGWRQQEPPKRQ